ncbi:2-amino-4-hydroxy-6-hydroxymethyldihydropteridine diphosphokinase [Oleispirillum naphthae]|uniref:2-amino-4-hydroxy-6- hydroxymethyldihydropteridine diphosphokinase n=1 Tax=Oleispirillum naphthae TaxID=2838853 RepID=UPI00308230A7
MILIALGGNLPTACGSPRQTLEAALLRFPAHGLAVAGRSPWYETAPVPVSDQPFFVNGVVCVETALDAAAAMAALHAIEAEFGRVRSVPNAARGLDLDLLDYRGEVRAASPVLPHPRLAERAFVLHPLRDVAPDWRHPVSGESAEELIARLPPGQKIRRLD